MRRSVMSAVTPINHESIPLYNPEIYMLEWLIGSITVTLLAGTFNHDPQLLLFSGLS